MNPRWWRILIPFFKMNSPLLFAQEKAACFRITGNVRLFGAGFRLKLEFAWVVTFERRRRLGRAHQRIITKLAASAFRVFHIGIPARTCFDRPRPVRAVAAVRLNFGSKKRSFLFSEHPLVSPPFLKGCRAAPVGGIRRESAAAGSILLI